MKAQEIYQQIHDRKRVIADLQDLINHVTVRRILYQADTLAVLERAKADEERQLENLANQEYNQ